MIKIVFIGLVAFCLSPLASSATALFLGIAFALLWGNPFSHITKKHTHTLLACSVVGLGAGMNLETVARAGLNGLGYTAGGLFLTFTLGHLLSLFLKVEKVTAILITAGTAICGGSAIAAIAPTLKAKSEQVSVALAAVFSLNAIALFIFPPLGHALGLTQNQFGLWSALAIHDTSSVVGATLSYGSEALQIGTTVKLARALWIVPIALGIGYFQRSTEKPRIPWFILYFLFIAATVTYLPSLQPLGHLAESGARKLLVLTLFLIGSHLDRAAIKSVGIKPLVLALLLWIGAAGISLATLKLVP